MELTNLVVNQTARNIMQQFGTDIEKARSGVYADNEENRKLNRVGQQYGGKKQEEPSKDKPKSKEEDPKGNKGAQKDERFSEDGIVGKDGGFNKQGKTYKRWVALREKVESGKATPEEKKEFAHLHNQYLNEKDRHAYEQSKQTDPKAKEPKYKTVEERRAEYEGKNKKEHGEQKLSLYIKEEEKLFDSLIHMKFGRSTENKFYQFVDKCAGEHASDVEYSKLQYNVAKRLKSYIIDNIRGGKIKLDNLDNIKRTIDWLSMAEHTMKSESKELESHGISVPADVILTSEGAWKVKEKAQKEISNAIKEDIDRLIFSFAGSKGAVTDWGSFNKIDNAMKPLLKNELSNLVDSLQWFIKNNNHDWYKDGVQDEFYNSLIKISEAIDLIEWPTSVLSDKQRDEVRRLCKERENIKKKPISYDLPE